MPLIPCCRDQAMLRLNDSAGWSTRPPAPALEDCGEPLTISDGLTRYETSLDRRAVLLLGGCMFDLRAARVGSGYRGFTSHALRASRTRTHYHGICKAM